jgi:hypothetical protein
MEIQIMACNRYKLVTELTVTGIPTLLLFTGIPTKSVLLDLQILYIYKQTMKLK